MAVSRAQNFHWQVPPSPTSVSETFGPLTFIETQGPIILHTLIPCDVLILIHGEWVDVDDIAVVTSTGSQSLVMLGGFHHELSIALGYVVMWSDGMFQINVYNLPWSLGAGTISECIENRLNLRSSIEYAVVKLTTSTVCFYFPSPGLFGHYTEQCKNG